MSGPTILWLRRDLRLRDHPALVEAARQAESAGVTAVFVVDPRLWAGGGDARRRWLADNVQALEHAYDGHLVLRVGAPEEVIPALASEVGARAVHISRESTPYGRRRDERVQAALGDVPLVATGTPYAVGPGRVLNGSGSAYKVFTPFARAWREHCWPAPADVPSPLRWHDARSDQQARALLKKARETGPAPAFAAGEEAALARWDEFVDEAVATYDTDRDLAAVDGTSRMSPYLKLGIVHPRTLLASLGARRGDGVETFRTELAWREFYADVLWHQPHSAWKDLRGNLAGMAYDEPGDDVRAWQSGRTGFPFVDAGMRQLLAEGWMHNRVRMVTASFLTKDLHVWWPIGARHFLEHLVDGDLASNNHGWQWVSGTGTDAAPYFRVFNPITQGQRFDPDGTYVRRWVPELRHLEGGAVHEPWKHTDGYVHGYPERIVDHAEERREALRRYENAR
ncbi:cryptochrome/photolyase family protein [Luteipulveratus mongoliensis]|uniref:Deoxyribodipyrimidine photolyase n=1 Tax=Luteipulveratus mongoliensis TaxID=571913 RepID=A0A0K1JGP1_9MICO|nr:deoxyribodipyrimidine photo-lyase [Luteipulveratus mongoliensis]AKU15892.1 deoxyribodipyrimidine photolyase [Luteipulveratus mongoliensis]